MKPKLVIVTVLFTLMLSYGLALDSGEFTAELNGLHLWYKVSGAGPVCVMPNPAWGPSSDVYFMTMHELEKSMTMVYLDCRGTGRSSRCSS